MGAISVGGAYRLKLRNVPSPRGSFPSSHFKDENPKVSQRVSKDGARCRSSDVREEAVNEERVGAGADGKDHVVPERMGGREASQDGS